MAGDGRPPGDRILFLSGLQIYPTMSGGTLRSFELASALKRHGLDVFVYSFTGRKKDYLARQPSRAQAWPEGIEEYVRRGLPGFLAQYGSYALSLPPLWLTSYLRLAASSPREIMLPSVLRERLGWCDVIVADFPFVHTAFDATSARGRLRVLSTHNVEHHLYPDGGRSRRLREKVRRIEVDAARRSDIVLACSADDKDFFDSVVGRRQTIVVPNGIDIRRLRGNAADRARVRGELGVGDETRVFLFTASTWGPNREAFARLADFSARNAHLLESLRIHILVVGSVIPAPMRRPCFTATGRVDRAEPYFAAADAALNPMWSGAGTNVKMCEFIASRLPVATTRLGARGFRIEDGETGFLFEEGGLGEVLKRMRRLFDEDPARLRGVAEAAYLANERLVSMDTCVEPLVKALADRRSAPEGRSATLQ
jgi:glycosyltransferase involved in cell wall biosynthesis